MKKKDNGFFCISLDFELYWGIRDKKTLEQYGENVLGAWKVVPKLLENFQKHNIHATWAAVGAMICENEEELKQFTPIIKPSYDDENLSPYSDFYNNIKNINSDYIFGKQLFELVKNAPNQEIGTHTFSHYYCLEPSQTKESFFSDLQSCIDVSKKNGINLNSFIFPRHQINKIYIEDFPKYGIEIYRETEKIWYNSPSRGEEEGIIKRAFRFADYFIKIGSHHCQKIKEVKNGNLYQIRASRWLRPFNKKLEKLDFLKIKRIKNQMTYAAKNGQIFHLWFHPHDIGKDISKNFEYIETIMLHYEFLNKKYNFKSGNFADIKKHIDEFYAI